MSPLGFLETALLFLGAALAGTLFATAFLWRRVQRRRTCRFGRSCGEMTTSQRLSMAGVFAQPSFTARF